MQSIFWRVTTSAAVDGPWGAMGFPSTSGWHHLVYTYDGNVTVKIYVDGHLDTLGRRLVTPTGEPIYIGCQNDLGQLFSGYINAVRVWGGAGINASSGSFTWRPTAAQADTTNLITLRVSNTATPSKQHEASLRNKRS